MKFNKLTKIKKLTSLKMDKQARSGFFNAIRYTLLCSRVMGLLPLAGLWHSNHYQLRNYYLCAFLSLIWAPNNYVLSVTNLFTFLIYYIDFLYRLNWSSLYTVLYIISFLGQCLMFLTSFCWLLHKGISLSNLTNALFYTSSLISFILLLNIGRHWPELTLKVEAIEMTLPPFRRNVARYCNLTMIFIFTFAAVEHLLSVLYGVVVAYSCDQDNTAETFFQYCMPWIFTYTKFAVWKTVFTEFFSIQSTFIWSFNDLLLANISIYLTEHFILQYELLKAAVNQEHFSAAEFRVQHLNIVRLVKLINGRIGIYILNSFGSNLYWICTQLFYSLNKTQTGHFHSCRDENHHLLEKQHILEHTVYFTYSFSFLVVRTLLVLILAARVHSHSYLPLMLLYGLPAEKFDVEVQRLITQINNVKVALSGLDFFFVTKTMILTLIGTIVTYELVLLQFNK